MGTLNELATRVKEQHDKFLEAINYEATSEAEILEVARQVVMPAMPALESQLDGLRGVVVAGERGSGRKLVLSADGRWFNDDEFLEDSVTVLDYWLLPTVLDGLKDALERQLRGQKDKRTEEAERRAARLHALAAVVKETL